jgi:hypothetical protein
MSIYVNGQDQTLSGMRFNTAPLTLQDIVDAKRKIERARIGDAYIAESLFPSIAIPGVGGSTTYLPLAPQGSKKLNSLYEQWMRGLISTQAYNERRAEIARQESIRRAFELPDDFTIDTAEARKAIDDMQRHVARIVEFNLFKLLLPMAYATNAGVYVKPSDPFAGTPDKTIASNLRSHLAKAAEHAAELEKRGFVVNVNECLTVSRPDLPKHTTRITKGSISIEKKVTL